MEPQLLLNVNSNSYVLYQTKSPLTTLNDLQM